MSEHGACLQTYNQELVKCLEEMKLKRVEVAEIILKEESKIEELERNISALQEKLDNVRSEMKDHKQRFDNYTKTIEETEAGFKKLLESSQTLLNHAQHQSNKLKTNAS